jgi:DNA-binding response OmpR family regulator
MATKICIVEDDASIQDVLKIILTRAGYETTIFSDGQAILDHKYEPPDLFLIDKQLPIVDGLVLCELLKADPSTASIPVIMMSAYPNVKEFSEEVKADGFLEKPFKIEGLLSTIRKHTQHFVAHV